MCLCVTVCNVVNIIILLSSKINADIIIQPPEFAKFNKPKSIVFKTVSPLAVVPQKNWVVIILFTVQYGFA